MKKQLLFCKGNYHHLCTFLPMLQYTKTELDSKKGKFKRKKLSGFKHSRLISIQIQLWNNRNYGIR